MTRKDLGLCLPGAVSAELRLCGPLWKKTMPNETDRLRDLIQRSRQLDQRIVQLQAAISELQRRCEGVVPQSSTGNTTRSPHTATRRGAVCT